MLMKEEGILLADSGFRNVSGRCGDAVYESRAAGFRHADMSQLHNVFRFPEDTCLPARRRPVYSVIITLGLDGMAFASGLNRREEQALLTNSGDVAAWVYSWAHTLATRYRRLGFEPVLLGSGWHGSDRRFTGRGETETFTWELECDGFVVSPRTPGRTLWQDILRLAGGDAVLVHPAAFPLVRTSGILLLMRAFAAARLNPAPCAGIRPLGRPVTGGEQAVPGWPVILDRGTLLELAEKGESGFHSLPPLRETDTADDCTVYSAMGIPPRELEKMKRIGARLSPDEARRLLNITGCPYKGFLHARAVAMAARAIAGTCRAAGGEVDPDLAEAGGFVHDIGKGYRRHETVGACYLEGLGLSELAWMTESHSDLVLSRKKRVSEREIVYLADKYCYGPRYVPLKERFGQKMELFRSRPGALEGIKKRLAHAMSLEKRIAEETGVNPADAARAVLTEKDYVESLGAMAVPPSAYGRPDFQESSDLDGATEGLRG